MPKVSGGQWVRSTVKASAVVGQSVRSSWSKRPQWKVKVAGPGAGVTAVVTDCLVNSDRS